MARRWSRAAQIKLEKPMHPCVPDCCPQCGCRWYFCDEDDDFLCFQCGRTLILWSVYRRELRHWKDGLAAQAEGYKRREDVA